MGEKTATKADVEKVRRDLRATEKRLSAKIDGGDKRLDAKIARAAGPSDPQW